MDDFFSARVDGYDEHMRDTIEGYVRFTSFNTRDNTIEAMRRIKELYSEG